VSPFYKMLYTQVIGLSERMLKIPVGSHNEVTIRCRASAVQSVELGELSAFLVYNMRIPPKYSLHRFLVSYHSQECVVINLHNPFDQLMRLNVTEYEFYEKNDGAKGGGNGIETSPEGSYTKAEYAEYFTVEAGGSFIAKLTVKNTCGLLLDKVKVDVVIIKPSAVGISLSREKIIVGTAFFNKLGGTETRTEWLVCNIPPDLDGGYYANEAALSVHMGAWVPSLDTFNGSLIKIEGEAASFISDEQFNQLYFNVLILIPILFGLAIVFVITKKYIYHKMDENYKKE